MRTTTTHNDQETRNLATRLAQEIKGGEIICLEGDLGSGKTTFAQGLLQALGAQGPYVSPTFLIMKDYLLSNGLTVYHIDAYRINEKDLLNIGWEEFSHSKKTICIIEWPENVSGIIPQNALRIHLSHLSENERTILW